ncbi:helix-turn-helix transcriptional regulator [Bdellovibrionota bacterium FG-2]
MKSEKVKPRRKRLATPLAANLQAVLEERKITIRAAAQLCGISPSVLHEWVNGAQCNNPPALLKLSQALGFDFQWALTGQRSEQVKSGAALAEMFDIQNDPAFSGIFMIEAKRLKRKDGA